MKFVSSFFVATVLFATVCSAQTAGLKDIYANYFRFGTILNGTTVNNAAMQNIVLAEFNSITPENELKPEATLVKNGSTNTDVKVQLSNGARAILKFCEDNNIPVRGHTLVWHSQTPGWFFRENFSDNGAVVSTTIMDQRMESYIKNMFAIIADNFPNLNLYAYDVVNEAASENGAPRAAGSNAGDGQSMWVQVYGGNSFVRKAFEFARKYAPKNTKLFYNDYNEYIPAKRDYIANSIVKPLFDDGLLDGMGMQAHLDARTGNDPYPSATLFGQAIAIYKNIGVEIQVTELDATVNNGNTSYFDAQATYYENIMKEILSKGGEAVTAVVVWGIQDNQSWRGDRTPILWNGNGQKKAAYNSVAGLIPETEWGDGDNPKGSGDPKDPPQTCGETPPNIGYKESFCGGAAFDDIRDNSASMPSSGRCLFIADFEQIEPDENSTVSINGTKRICTTGWEADGSGDCGPIAKPEKVDGGYYVFVEEGSINAYTEPNATESNGWKGVEAGKKPSCDGISPIVRASVQNIYLQYLGNGNLRFETAVPKTVEIFNIKGNKVSSFNASGSQTVKLSLPSGIYFAKMSGSSVIKFMLK